MDLVLTRFHFLDNGIFGQLFEKSGGQIAFTLEHAFPVTDSALPASHPVMPKLPSGSYLCQRGTHKLEHSDPFETFEILGVPGHSGILFHVGNFNRDSNGCVLLGAGLELDSNGTQLIKDSRVAFDAFLRLQQGVSEFQLTVFDA